MVAPFELEQTVYIEDTDQYGVVYYANYLKYFERVRTEWLNAHQLTLTECLENDIIFAVKEVSMQYNRPLKLHDRFIITALPKIRSRSSVVFEQTLYRVNEPSTIMCEGKVILVAINAQHKVVRVPHRIADVMTSG